MHFKNETPLSKPSDRLMDPGMPNQNTDSAETSHPMIEYRSSDDAWYSVHISLDGETLVICYRDLSDKFDERIGAGGFQNLKELEEFKKRFRPVSYQLQDEECRKLVEGTAVCVSHVFGEDVRFYDAVVDEACFSEHAFVNGYEECKCTFLVLWAHGPNGGKKTKTSIEDICLLQSGSTLSDPNLHRFLEISKKKLTTLEPRACDSKVKARSYFQEKNNDDDNDDDDDDDDLGGGYLKYNGFQAAATHYHFILIDNIERDLLPSTMVDFIYQQTSISVEAYVFPSILSQSYARGIIYIKSKEMLEKLFGFLLDLSHLVISSRGRPWVTEKRWSTFDVTFCGLMLNSEKIPPKKSERLDKKIRVAHRGTKEYEKALKLRELFMHFHEHVQRLHSRLAFEERKLLQ